MRGMPKQPKQLKMAVRTAQGSTKLGLASAASPTKGARALQSGRRGRSLGRGR